MFWRTMFQGGPQGAPLFTFVFVLVSCISYTFSQNTAPGNPSISGPIGVLEGSEVTFNCTSIQGIPPPSVVWYRGNNIVDSSYTSGSQNGVTVSFNNYTFNATRFDHGVSFRCVVDNSALTSGPLNRTWIMSVYVPPGTPVLTGPSSVVAGTSYVYRCVTSGGNPAANITWELGGQTLNTGFQNSISQNNDNTFVISSNLSWAPNTADNGKSLSCIVEHRPTLGNNVLTVNRAISVNVVPQVSVTQSVYTRIVGSSVTLSCSITNANPPVNQVWWTRNSNGNVQNITIDGSKYSGSSTSNPSLTISSLQTSDIATYQCLASNGVGTGASLTTFLNITGSIPSVSIPVSSYTSTVGNSVNMVCNVVSTLTVTSVYWRFTSTSGVTTNVVTGAAGGNRFTGATVSSPSLVLLSSTLQDQGTYRCFATNSAGTGQSAGLTLTVQGNIPSVSISQSSYTVNQGNTVTLVCSVSSSTSTPLTSVQWQKIIGSSFVNLDTSQTSKYSGSSTFVPSLTIFNAQSSDAGSYRCTATNTVGTGQSLSTTLSINVPPSVNLGQSSYSVNFGATVTLVCSITSNVPILSVSWQQTTTSGSIINLSLSSNSNKYSGGTPSSPNLVIFNAATSDAGSYRCTATSSAGTGQSGLSTLTVVGNLPSVSITSQSPLSVAIGNTITIGCAVSANPSATAVIWRRTVNGITSTVSIIGNSRYSGGTTSTPSLTITNAQLGDEGSYQCQAVNSAGTGSSGSVFVDVTGSIPSVVTGNGATVTIGNQVTITCSISGFPTYTSVSWTRELNGVTTTLNIAGNNRYSGGTVSTPSLTITNVQDSDEGNYRCSASNSVGTGQSSTTAFLNVQGGVPSVVIGSGSSPTVGSSATITCSVSGNPAVTSISWQRTTNGVTTTLNLVNTAKYSGGTVSIPSLTIFNVQTSDAGSYVCRASNSVGQGSSGAAFLNVVGTTPTVQVGSSSYSVMAGNTANLICSITSQNPAATSITWQRQIGGVTSTVVISSSSRYSGGTVSNPTLTITNVQQSDEGTYFCSASNNIGQGSTAQTFLDVLNLPQTSVSQSQYNINIGNSVTLQCFVSSTPSASSITWRRSSNGVVTTINVQLSRYSGGTVSTPSLTISNVQTSDSGTYSCVATNSVGSSSPANTTLNVIGALPSVSIPSSSYSVNYGGTITIPCQVSSNPFQNTVFWRRTRNGVTTTLSISGKYSGGSVNTPSLTISNTDLQDEGTYTCSATNSAGTTTSNTITLDVIGNAPSVNIPNTQYTVTFGASVTIPCFVTASPTATSVQWTRISNGVTTTLSIPGSNNKYGGGTVSSPSLTISNTDNNDEGTYRCTATNAVSSSTDSAFLDVQGNFPSVSIPQTTYTVSFSGAVTLVCNIQASPSVVSVSWFRILNSGTSLITVSGSNKYSGSTVSTPSLTISNADLSDEGSYQCSAINSVGTGTSGTTFLDVLGNIPSVSIPQSIYTVTYGQDRTITCSVSANPGATSITWQFQTGSSTTTVAVGNTAKYSGGSVSTPSLTIKNAASSDEGNYRCRATNAAGTGESALAFLDVTGNSPSVSIPSSSYSVNYGSTITIPCTINANPVALSINWYKDSSAQPISISGRFSGGSVSTPALTISSTLLTDEGNYRCSATNAVGTGNSFNTFLDVVGNVPSVTITPPSNVVIGNNITITCSYNSNPTATAVAWRRTQGTTTTLTMGGRYSGGSLAVPSLTITNVQSNDQGSYQCVVTNAVGEGQSSSAFVSVQGNVPTVTIPQNSYSVVYGNTITIPCSISSNPSATTMRWERTANFNTDILTTTGSSKYSGGTLSTPSLTILNTDSNDQADYRCIATNQVGDGFSATTSLTVQGDAPIVSIPQDSYSVLIGSNRVLPCTVSAFPAVTSVYWVFDPSGSGSNVNIQQSFGRYVLSPSTSSPDLTVNNAVQSDAGTYSCFAINAVGTVSDTTTLNITGTVPSVDIALSSYSVLTGDSITIPCVVTASPATTSLYWVFDPSGSGSNIQITSSQGRYTVGTSTNNPSLTISNTNSGDVGTYTCTAINQVGQSSDAASLAVTGNVPVVSIPSSSYSALQTSTIVIPCNITNTPVPAVDQVRWFYSSTANNPNPNLVLINSTSRYTGGTPGSPSLTIGGVLNSDQGYYRCSASNPVGTATSGTTFLTVTGAVPSQTTISQGSALSIQRTNTLTLSCTANGDPAPTIAWSFNGQILTTSGGTYTKANIQRTDDGIYTCTATNSLGSQTATVDVDVQYSPIASSSSVSLSVVVDNSQTLTCNVEANPSVTTWQWSRNGQVVSTGSQTYTKTFSSGDFGDYICTAQNSLGSATVTFTVSQSTLDTGAATAGGGLTSGEIAAIVLAVLLLIILIIVICICCCTHGVCGAICGKKKDPKGRVEPSKEKEVYKETIRQIEIPRFEEKQKPKVRESSAVSRRDVDLKVNNHYRKENEYDIIRYETVPPASTHYGDTIISVQDDVRPSPRPHRLPALTAYTYDEEERRRKRKKKRKHRSRKHRDGTEEVIIEKVRTASPIRVIEEPAVIVERVRSGSPVRYIEEPAQDVVIDYVNPELTTVIYSSSEDPAIVETVRRTPSSRRRRSDEEEMIVERTSSRSPSRRRRHEEHYVTTERVVNGDVYRDGGDLRAINGEVYRHSGEYSLSRHGSGRFTTEGSTRRRNYEESEDVEVVPGEEYYIERR